ncbi:universal stress protein [Rufibacter roseolus]|uniref:universal stress protein n=1 Tax=Rufibacter roseolus TaxID=2817375 RepID=UPI001B308469|nr:universal stress protein [Rufibacter roseolus]
MGRFICATDFSGASENAIQYAGEIGQRINSEIVLFHNICETKEPVMVTASGENHCPIAREKEQKKEARAQMKRLQTYLENGDEDFSLGYKSKISHGDTSQTIATLAQEEHADLVVLGSDPSHGLREMVDQSLTARIIKQVPCPVLVVPGNVSFRPIRRMVLTIDLHGFCPANMAEVLKLAGYFGAQLQLLFVLPKEEPTARQFVEEELERISKRLPYQRITRHIEVNPSVEEGISQFCFNHRADMLVVGAHATNVWKHLLQPGHQQTPSYYPNLPLLVVHPKKIRL